MKNPMAEMIRSTHPVPCCRCGKTVKDKYVIYDSGAFYHMKCFQEAVGRKQVMRPDVKRTIWDKLKGNPFPQICANCGAKIYGVLTPVFCPKCRKPWKETKNPK